MALTYNQPFGTSVCLIRRDLDHIYVDLFGIQSTSPLVAVSVHLLSGVLERLHRLSTNPQNQKRQGHE